MMNKTISKKIMAAVISGLVFFSGAEAGNVVFAEVASPSAVAVNVQIQHDLKGTIDWTKGSASDVTVTGIGLPPENAGTDGVVLARRAAIVDAYRNLAEVIEGVQVDSDTVMHDCMIHSDTVRIQVSALIKGAKILEEGTDGRGRYYVRMSLPLFGSGNSLASVAIPAIRPAAVEPLPSVDVTGLSAQEVKAVQSSGYTGVIVDAGGLGLEATFSPVIYDTDGRAVYGMKNIDPDFAISQGMVEYASSVENALSNSRAGANPLVVKAVAVRGGRNSVNKVNVVVPVADGDRILLANEKTWMLQNCSVVFVK